MRVAFLRPSFSMMTMFKAYVSSPCHISPRQAGGRGVYHIARDTSCSTPYVVRGLRAESMRHNSARFSWTLVVGSRSIKDMPKSDRVNECECPSSGGGQESAWGRRTVVQFQQPINPHMTHTTLESSNTTHYITSETCGVQIACVHVNNSAAM